MLGLQVKGDVAGAYALSFFVGSVFASLFLMTSVPLDSLATPTQLCQTELMLVALFFLASFAMAEPAKAALEHRASWVRRLLQLSLRLPAVVRAAAILLVVWGSFAYAFWTIGCVLGGYNGYTYAFRAYPFLALIYNHSIGLVPYLSARDKGTQASFYFALAIVGFTALRANKGIGQAVKEAITLFAAPAVILYELGLWYSAPEDMTWHVTDFLYMGGVADGGWRSFDNGNPYWISNWLVLFVCLCLIASRIPWIYQAVSAFKASIASPEPRL